MNVLVLAPIRRAYFLEAVWAEQVRSRFPKGLMRSFLAFSPVPHLRRRSSNLLSSVHETGFFGRALSQCFCDLLGLSNRFSENRVGLVGAEVNAVSGTGLDTEKLNSDFQQPLIERKAS